MRLGILYIVPVLLVTWHDGLSWGIAFAVGTGVLRFMTGLEKLPPDTTIAARLTNEAAFQVVLIVAMAGIAKLQRTQATLEQLATHDPLTGALNARSFVERLAQELERIGATAVRSRCSTSISMTSRS